MMRCKTTLATWHFGCIHQLHVLSALTDAIDIPGGTTAEVSDAGHSDGINTHQLDTCNRPLRVCIQAICQRAESPMVRCMAESVMMNMRTCETQHEMLAQAVVAHDEGSLLLQSDRRMQVLLL